MKRIFALLITFLFVSILFSKNQTDFESKIISKKDNLEIKQKESQSFEFQLDKGKQYKIFVLQKGIDVVIKLKDNQLAVLKEKDSPNGINGSETFDYIPTYTGRYTLIVEVLEDPQNEKQGKFDYTISEYSTQELEYIASEIVRKEKAIEKSKEIETSDAENFYKTFDLLKNAKSRQDSMNLIQLNYFDKASGGLIEAIDLLNLTPEKYVNAISMKPKFYTSLRKEILYYWSSTVPLINSFVDNYKKIYSNYKPFKTCFIVGLGTGGGLDVFTSKHFVTVTCESVCATEGKTDFSECSPKLKDFLVRGGNISQQIMERVGHEATHFQQKGKKYEIDQKCDLLNGTIIESICDWVSYYLTNLEKEKGLRGDAYKYYPTKKIETWKKFQNEMCSPTPSEWLFNSTTNDIPGNLGFAIGVDIVETYFKNHKKIDGKEKTITTIIDMLNPSKFLEESGYPLKMNK